VPALAQKIDAKVYYRLTVQTMEGPINLSVFEFQKGKYAANVKEPSATDASQLWRFVDVGKGFFRLVNATQPSLSLDLASDKKSKVDLVLAKTSAGQGQHWKLSSLFDGFRLSNRSQAAKCIVASMDPAALTVALGKFEGSSVQSWGLNKTEISVSATALKVVETKLDPKFYYRLTNKGSVVTGVPNDWVLGLREDQEGIKPDMSEPSEALNQLWRFVDLENGFYRVSNASQPSLSLELFQSPEMAEYQYMTLRPTADKTAQHWKISPNGNGFRLTNRWKADQSIEDNENGVRTEKTGTLVSQEWVLNKTDIKADAKPVAEKFELTSTSFVNGEELPFKYTGKDGVSPPLAWKGAPAGTKSFMILCTDPDAPSPANPDPNPFVHWFILNIPADTKYLLSGIPRLQQVSTPFGAVQLDNSAGETGYTGPMPPKGSGKHRYFFTIFAMDRVHVIDPKLTIEEFAKTLQSSTLATAQLMGTYEVRASLMQDSRMVFEMALRAAQLSNAVGIRH
jgi:Raf kinase inhibitor-like YbhB/YbcL family protein